MKQYCINSAATSQTLISVRSFKFKYGVGYQEYFVFRFNLIFFPFKIYNRILVLVNIISDLLFLLGYLLFTV
jgi:hypothetical protein